MGANLLGNSFTSHFRSASFVGRQGRLVIVVPKVTIGVLGVCAECSSPLVNYLRRRPFEVPAHAMRAALRVSNFNTARKGTSRFSGGRFSDSRFCGGSGLPACVHFIVAPPFLRQRGIIFCLLSFYGKQRATKSQRQRRPADSRRPRGGIPFGARAFANKSRATL